MRVNIYSCLVVFVLGCNITAAIKHEIVEEKKSVSLPCPRRVEGEVTWSREANGHRVDILTAGGDVEKKHIADPGRRYSSQADPFKSLYIRRVSISDSGTYLCNNEAAVKLTVVPSEPTRLIAPKLNTVTLNCPRDVGGSDVPTWSKDGHEVQQDDRVYVSPVNKTLTITCVVSTDSGLYYCDGKPAAYLTVIEAIKHETVQEKRSVYLPCPRRVEGEVTWSRETNGHRVDILTAGGDVEKKHIADPGRRYSSLADKSLYIRRVTISDSGTYLCNNEAAVKLTVVPSGTYRLVAPKSTTVTLDCPRDVEGSDVPTWSKDGHDVQQDEHVYVSPANKTLTITHVKLHDAGLYYCDGRPAMYLTVMEAETSDRGTTRLVAPQLTTVTLDCPHDVGGSDVPTWSTDGREVQQNEWVYVSPVNKTLTIRYVLPRESGLYYCDGKPAAYLTVIEEPNRLIAPKLNTVTLNCPRDGGRSDVPTWSKDGREVHQDEYVYVSPVNKTLTITHVTPREAGLYYCDGKLTAYLTVMEAETSDRGTTRLVAPQWNTVTLDCPHDVGGSDVPTWSKDGREVQQDEWVHVSPVNKTLTITYVLPSESGLYYCDGKPAAYLTVIEETTRLIATQLNTVTLNCPRDVGGSDVRTWTKDGHDVQQDEYVYVSPANKTLTITHVTPRDSGLYYCYGRPAAYLTVMEAETSDRGTTRLVAPQLNTVILDCPHDVGGSDVPTWSTDGREVQQDEWVHVSPVNKTLTIRYVLPSESGLYYCDGKPAAYLTVIEETTRLIVPKFTTVTLDCPRDVGGSDVTTWSKDGRDVQQDEHVYVSPVDKTLTITHVKLHDAGLYYCDGKPAVYLTVMEAETSDRAAPHLWQTVRLVIGGLYLIIMISITATAWIKARQEQKRRATQRENDV